MFHETVPQLDCQQDFFESEGYAVWLWRGGWDGESLQMEVGLRAMPESVAGLQAWELLQAVDFPFRVTATWATGETVDGEPGNGTVDVAALVAGEPYMFVSDMRVPCPSGVLPESLRVDFLGERLWEIPLHR